MSAQGLPVLEAAHLLHLSACLPPAQGSLEVAQDEHRGPSVTVATVVAAVVSGPGESSIHCLGILD